MAIDESLADCKVLELGTTITGPYTAEILGSLGADVIKVESPSGDPFRDLEPKTEDGVSGQFAMLNCGKRSICLDLKAEEATEVFLDLAETADVVVENFTTGTVERLGIGYDTITELNEEIVYCSISGYGESGPDSDRPGFGPILQAETGLMSVTGEPDRPPVRVGVPAIDFLSSVWAALSVVSALRRRDRTGEGSYVETAMFDAGMSFMGKRAAHFLLTGEEPQRMGTGNAYAAPFGAYETEEGERIMLVAPYQPMWEQLCDTLGREDLLEDDRFETLPDRVEHREALDDILAEVFATRPREEWLERFDGTIPVGPVRGVGEALNSEQAAENDVTTEVAHPEHDPMEVVNLPLRADGDRQRFERAPPDLGEHSREILAEIDYSEAAIDDLEARRVI